MDENWKILYKFKKKKFAKRLLWAFSGLYLMLLIIILLTFKSLNIIIFQTKESIIISSIFITIMCIVYPFFLYSYRCRYDILEVALNSEFVKVKYLDRDKECSVIIELKNLRMDIYNVGSYPRVYKLDIYDGNLKILYQVSGLNWMNGMIKELYKQLEKYNKLNSTSIKI